MKTIYKNSQVIILRPVIRLYFCKQNRHLEFNMKSKFHDFLTLLSPAERLTGFGFTTLEDWFAIDPFLYIEE